MDDLIEILLERSHELLKSKKVSKTIRYSIAFTFINIIICAIVLGIMLFDDSIINEIFIISVVLFLLVGISIKTRNYLKIN